MGLTCGIPSVTLEGDKQDWEKLLARIDRLSVFGKEPEAWSAMLRPILTRFVQAFDGQPGTDFWNHVCHYQHMGSGSDFLGGWITAFCVWDKHGKWKRSISINDILVKAEERSRTGAHASPSIHSDARNWILEVDGMPYPTISVDDIPPGYCEVDVHLDDNGEHFDCARQTRSHTTDREQRGKPSGLAPALTVFRKPRTTPAGPPDSDSPSSDSDLSSDHSESDSEVDGQPLTFPHTHIPNLATYPHPSTPLPTTVIAMSQGAPVEGRAFVIHTKLKDPPLLTPGTVDPRTMYDWATACRKYQKHAGKTDADIVSFVADGMQEVRLGEWYRASTRRIDALTLDEFFREVRAIVLEPTWAHDLREEILRYEQGDQKFTDFKIHMENLNSLLKSMSSIHALTEDALKIQMEARLHPYLRKSLNLEPVLSRDIAAWSLEVKNRDERIRQEDEHIQAKLDALEALRNAARRERKEKKATSSSSTYVPNPNHTKTAAAASGTARVNLPGLTDPEKALLDAHEGCRKCRRFYVGHRTATCTNPFPPGLGYKTLTLEMALSAQRAQAGTASTASTSRIPAGNINVSTTTPADDETDSDSYVPLSTPMTEEHLFPLMEIDGPSLEGPISIQPMLDTGSPSIVISDSLVTQLGLRRYRLPPSEDNLSSIDCTPLECKESIEQRFIIILPYRYC
ncbi:hypothetical protein D9619_008691 [Psilocybe cf. subviscida]|uniref:Retrotransposon gag domain-containing protein n=1 Tax=Psilocybe cf. subviscida TaxID=2480587 RepID=A0A8H5F0R4_9AGAR|nr:hypothetical protein D9619_008691 [Psilocybe cf. subviscida]